MIRTEPQPVSLSPLAWFRLPVVAWPAIILLVACWGWWLLLPDATERRLTGYWRFHTVEKDGSISITHSRLDPSGQYLSRVSPGSPYVEEGFLWSASPGRFYIQPDRSIRERLSMLAQFRFGSSRTTYTFEWMSDDEIQLTGIIEDGRLVGFDVRGFREGTAAIPTETQP